jgi:hypothetical protein
VLLCSLKQLIHLLVGSHLMDEVQRVHHLAWHAVIRMDQDVGQGLVIDLVI